MTQGQSESVMDEGAAPAQAFAAPDAVRARRATSRTQLELIALLVGSLAALALAYLSLREDDTDYEKLAFGKATAPPPPRVDGTAILCRGFRIPEDVVWKKQIDTLDDCIQGVQRRRASDVVLWLGNSQVEAVNQYQPGDTNAARPIHERLAPHGLDFVVGTYPNANQQEHLLVYSYMKPRMPLRAVVLSLVFDDFREEGIRDRLTDALRDPQSQQTLRRSESGRRLLSSDAVEPPSDLAPKTTQDRSEAFLTDFLTRHSEFWRTRDKVRGWMFTSLYRLRNSVFQVNPQSRRRVIPGRYSENRQAIEALLEDAARSNIVVLGYIVPLRDDITPPYDPQQYKDFIADMRQLFEEHHAPLRNLEKLVPARYWGSKPSTSVGETQELDFMHFQGPGHQLVAAALSDFVLAYVRPL